MVLNEVMDWSTRTYNKMPKVAQNGITSVCVFVFPTRQLPVKPFVPLSEMKTE